MNHKDLLGFKRHEEDENVTNREKRNPINERTGIQNLVSQLVDADRMQYSLWKNSSV